MLPRDIARRMRLFEVRTRKLMESGLGGEYRSVFRGRGVEFEEVRPYVEGDDVRDLAVEIHPEVHHDLGLHLIA